MADISCSQVLVETVRTSERHVSVMATILMAQLLHLTNIILPPGYSSDAHSLPDLIASALDFQDLQDKRKLEFSSGLQGPGLGRGSKE